MSLKPTRILLTSLIALICLTSCEFTVHDTSIGSSKHPKPEYKTSRNSLKESIANIIDADDVNISWRYQSNPMPTNKFVVEIINPNKKLIMDDLINDFSQQIKSVTEAEVKNINDFDGLVIEFKKEDTINDIERQVSYKKTYDL